MEQIMINHYVHFSRLVQGFWRANEWKMTAKELNYFINELVERGITTMIMLIFMGIINVNHCLVMLWIYHPN